MTEILPRTVTTDAAVTDTATALLPIGSFEQHGPHLPLATDTLIAVAIANAIADRHPVRLLPPITISCSHEHAAFAGTVSISAATLTAVISDIADSLLQQSITQLLIVNGHGGNYVLSNITQQANLGPVRMALYPTRSDWGRAPHDAAMTSDAHNDMHAGELETSILLATFADHLRDGWQHDDHEAPDRPHLLTLGMTAYTRTGVIGHPSLATPEKGQRALHSLAASAEQAIGAMTRHRAEP